EVPKLSRVLGVGTMSSICRGSSASHSYAVSANIPFFIPPLNNDINQLTGPQELSLVMSSKISFSPEIFFNKVVGGG
ncbi:hypothetical protein Tco_0096044, partial [Tanacetum coccineum]